MKTKKVRIIVFSIISLVAVAGIITSVYLFPYKIDFKDTEESFRSSLSLAPYENTLETAIPQTELYNKITEHFNSPLAEGKTVKKAIVIGYDGCRADALALLKDEDSAISKMLRDGASCNLSYCGGVNYPDKNTQDTSTAPGWCSILTGQWADKTGVTGNGIPKSMEYKTLLTTLTEDKIIDFASFTTIWNGHFVKENSTYKPEKEYCEKNDLNVSFNLCENNEKSAESVIAEINVMDCTDFIFVVYEGTDAAGHSTGFTLNNPKYQSGFAECEKLAFDTINAIENRENYATEDWLIIITSDHGGYGTAHGGETIQERMTFIVYNK